MNKKLLLGITLALSSTVAFAASFENHDNNGDGKLTPDEFYGSVSDMGTYSDWDTSGDGLIDENEWTTLGWDYDYNTWDANSDGWLNSGEFYDGSYWSYDENEDGYWDNGEWDNAGKAGLYGMPSFDGHDSNGDGKFTTDEFYGSVNDIGLYSDWDTSGDGLIDENEWTTLGWDSGYNTWDVNSDGWLNSGEFYDGTYNMYDANEDGHWDNGEWDDAGDAGLFDM
jgi:hypothetical protein